MVIVGARSCIPCSAHRVLLVQRGFLFLLPPQSYKIAQESSPADFEDAQTAKGNRRGRRSSVEKMEVFCASGATALNAPQDVQTYANC